MQCECSLTRVITWPGFRPLIGREWSHDGILASNWSRLITWPGYWPLIGVAMIMTGLWLVITCYDLLRLVVTLLCYQLPGPVWDVMYKIIIRYRSCQSVRPNNSQQLIKHAENTRCSDVCDLYHTKPNNTHSLKFVGWKNVREIRPNKQLEIQQNPMCQFGARGWNFIINCWVSPGYFIVTTMQCWTEIGVKLRLMWHAVTQWNKSNISDGDL